MVSAPLNNPGRANTFSTADFPWLVRALTRFVLVPLGRLVFAITEKLGYTDPLWQMIGRKLRKDVLTGNDFGDYRPTAQDVIVCTYPKRGTNWAMQITHQIATRGTGEFAHVHAVVPWPDFKDQSMILPLADSSVLAKSPTG